MTVQRDGCGDLPGRRTLRKPADIPDRRQREAVERVLEYGLEAAPSVQDLTLPRSRAATGRPSRRTSTLREAPCCEDIRDVAECEAAVVGAPFDLGTTYRAACRFGPRAVRRISALYDPYNVDMGIGLEEQLAMCDAGDIFAIPSDVDKLGRPAPVADTAVEGNPTDAGGDDGD